MIEMVGFPAHIARKLWMQSCGGARVIRVDGIFYAINEIPRQNIGEEFITLSLTRMDVIRNQNHFNIGIK